MGQEGVTILVIAEHDAPKEAPLGGNASIKASTLNTIAAASKIGGDVHVLVAGSNAQAAADAAAKIAGVSKVLLADAPQLADGLAENVEGTVLNIAKDYSHILAPATAYGKNIAPRIAAHLDVAQISDIAKQAALQEAAQFGMIGLNLDDGRRRSERADGSVGTRQVVRRRRDQRSR